jgi:hypothetical protein
MRNFFQIVALFGCIAVARGEDAAGTNTESPRTIHAARVIMQS